MADEIEISIIKYDSEFTKRSKDIKRNTWFSFPNDILLHPDFTEITGEELKWFIWIVSICSKINQNKIRLNITHAQKIVSLNRKDLFSMINKLQGKQIDTTARPCGGHAATERGHAAASTLHNNTLHNNTNITNNTHLVPTSNEIGTVTNSKSNFSKSIEKVYSDHYPLKKGKSKGVAILSKQIFNDDDLDSLIRAIKKYKLTIKDPQYTKHFSTFANEWRDWLDENAGASDITIKQSENVRETNEDEKINNLQSGFYE